MMHTVRRAMALAPRLSGWIIATIFLVALVARLSEQQIGVMVYKTALVTLASILSYWLDRSLFADSAQPRLNTYGTDSRDLFAAARLLARALVYLGTVLGLTLGL